MSRNRHRQSSPASQANNLFARLADGNRFAPYIVTQARDAIEVLRAGHPDLALIHANNIINAPNPSHAATELATQAAQHLEYVIS